jgi:hypothetical protein
MFVCLRMKGESYRTVRACSSTGAPESTAAGVDSPGSLPSITLVGIGEKALSMLALQPDIGIVRLTRFGSR